MILRYRKHLLASASSAFALLASVSPTGVMAQAAPGTTPEAAPALPKTYSPEPKEDKDIVVTGSRIRRNNFDTPSEVNVISKQDFDGAGYRDIASALQSATITSGTSQINGAFLGFVSEGGPAANTIGLRGLGSSRTLLLLNGRRLAPSGVGPQLVAADLNVLPTAIVDRTEILREGASSVYGSDAIAGVINVITDTKLNGITIEGFDSQPTGTGGAGNTLRGSIAAGKVFNRGHISASFEYKNAQGLVASSRPGFSCPRDLLYNPSTGAEVGAIDPATGGLSCYPYALGSGAGIASGYGIAEGFNGTFNRITYTNGNINTLNTVNGLTRVSPSPVQNEDTVISPIKTYTGYLNGAYELQALGDAEIYGEALFTRRESHQQSASQLSINQANLSPGVQVYGGSYAGTPVSAYGYPTSPFFPKSVAAAGYNYFTPFIVPQQLSTSTQRVDYVRANGGIRGKLNIGDWRYDANFQYSHTNSTNTTTGLTTSSRFSNSLQAVAAPAGTPANLITTAIAGEAGAGGNYTCASNVSAAGTYIPGSSCVPIDIYNPKTVINGAIPSNVYNYLFQPETDRTKYTEETISINLDGTLFTLPAGAVKAAVGFEHRYDSLDDTPPLDAQNGDLYNYSSGGITKGTDEVNEAYGELNVPVLADKPWAKLMELDLSGRYTHYRSYGHDFTYHINGQYAVNDMVRFRGNYGTSFRAPNLYEQFIANQTGFLGGGVDPCSQYGTVVAPGTTLYKNCTAALSGTGVPGGPTAFVANAGPEIITEGGAGKVKSETSTTWGGGMVLTAPAHTIDLSLALDYFNITVNGEIQQLGQTILTRCYEATDFGASNPYCALIAPREVGGSQPGTLTSFQNPYINVAKQKASGVDFDLQYATHVLGGRFSARVQGTRNIHQEYQPFAGEPIVDYNGTLGEQGAGAGPKVVGDFQANWTDKTRTFSVQYGLKYVGKQDSTALVGQYTAGLGLGNVNTIAYVNPYFEHSISFKFHFPDLGDFTVGVTNLTDSHPPLVSQTPLTSGEYTRIGNYFNSSNYD